MIAITIAAALAGMVYMGFLWWKSRQVQFVRYKEFGIPMPADYSIHGIDVSRYQQTISWEAVKKMRVHDIKIGFAFIKATEGARNWDPFFKQNWKKARKAGMVRGAYHFFIPWKGGRLQAENFISKVTLERGDLPPVLDVEQLSSTSVIQLQTEIKEWLEVIEEYYSVRPIIYTNADFYKRNLGNNFDDYPLWVAHYLQPHQPRVARGWAFWQHNERGRVNGIRSRVDFNVFNGDSVAFKSLLVP